MANITHTDLDAYYKSKGVKHAVPSYYDVVDYNGPGGSMVVEDVRHKIRIRGQVKFVAEHDSYWGRGESYESPVVEDPTWDDIMRLADAMIKATGDYHHVFVEDVRVTGEVDGVKTAEFVMGS